jgi:hypothetical protein
MTKYIEEYLTRDKIGRLNEITFEDSEEGTHYKMMIVNMKITPSFEFLEKYPQYIFSKNCNTIYFQYGCLYPYEHYIRVTSNSTIPKLMDDYSESDRENEFDIWAIELV